MKKRIVVICPGRGSYTKETLGYLKSFGQPIRDFITDIDQRRQEIGEPTITELDSAETFKPQLHTRGEHASPLIYTCAYADFMSINRDKYEIVAVTGNSMGWYLALMFGGALDWRGGFEIVNGMGSMMKTEIIGGQVIYPICDEEWRIQPERLQVVKDAIHKANGRDGVEVYTSIYLGGYLVIGANKPGVAALLKDLPQTENYPFSPINHAAFHTPLLRQTSLQALEQFSPELFSTPNVPLIDGRGYIWTPYATDIGELHRYTLAHQVTEAYDFTTSISVALKEFAPDHLVLLGPGSSLGGSIGQILIANNWLGLSTKTQFTKRQVEAPILLSMGRSDQRNSLI